jgi:hypothetical protein
LARSPGDPRGFGVNGFELRRELEEIIFDLPLPLPLIEQSRQAEHDRLTALPGVEPDGWAMSGERTINGPHDVATKLAR